MKIANLMSCCGTLAVGCRTVGNGEDVSAKFRSKVNNLLPHGIIDSHLLVPVRLQLSYGVVGTGVGVLTVSVVLLAQMRKVDTYDGTSDGLDKVT
jgi:hypothetical protein